MKKGENIYKRKDGRFEGRYVIGLTEEGRKKYGSVYGPTKTAVRKKLAEAKAKIRNAETISKYDISFEEAAINWLHTISNLKATTYSTYRSYVNVLIPIIGDYRINQIDQNVKGDVICVLKKRDYKETTIRAYIKIVERIVSASIERSTSSLKYSEDNTEQVHTLELIPDDEFELLTEEIQRDVNLCKLAISLIAFAGLKIGEVCGLKWGMIDFDQNTLTIDSTIQRTKSRNGAKNATNVEVMNIKPRTIYMPINLAELLKRYKGLAKSNYYVVSGSRMLKENRTIQYKMKILFESLGMPNYTTTAIRNTFAVHSLENGVNPKALAIMLGVGLESILKYYEYIEVDLKKEVQKIK